MKIKRLRPGAAGLLLFAILQVLAAQPVAPDGLKIRTVDIIHHAHTDVGFTDMPVVARELHARYIDAAVDICAKDARFRWATESMLGVDDWWRGASPERRNLFLNLIRKGQIEVTAMPFNQTPFMNAAQWNQALNWVPESLWRQFHPTLAMQSDVNGMPRAGVLKLLDHGVRYLYMGLNDDSGGPPFPRPTAFWWKMPDGRRIFVWLGETYGAAYNLFEPEEWRKGPVPRAANTAYRPPRAGEILKTDEASLRAAHRRCVAKLLALQKSGYPFERVMYSYTNQWRYDNDPPFPALADFVAAWNKLGLKPELRLTTPSVALASLEKEAGARLPVVEGEWTDWWANGAASGPREVAATREAKRLLEAASSPVWGAENAGFRGKSEEILKSLCLFDEHTWGSSNSVALPDSLDSIGQYVEKSILAYRPLGQAEWLLSQRARTSLDGRPEGLYVTNTAAAPYTGWVRFPAMALRGDYRSLLNPATGEKTPLELESGLQQWFRPRKPEDLTPENTPEVFGDNVPDQVARFWVEDLPPRTTVALRLTKDIATAAARIEAAQVTLDERGWPSSISWPGMKKPLFTSGTGDFVAFGTKAFAARWELKDRKRELLSSVPSAPQATTVEHTPHSTLYTQRFAHPSLKWAARRLEVWNDTPHARLTVRFDRLSSEQPEYYFVNFACPVQGVLPEFSNGGLPFVPFREQIPGTCADYFAIDGWARYESEDGDWLWVSRDAPLVSVGGPHMLERIKQPPADLHRLMAMVFDNSWYTNFVGNSHGVMEFEFDLLWQPRMSNAAEVAGTAVSKPVVLVNPAEREAPALLERLFRP